MALFWFFCFFIAVVVNSGKKTGLRKQIQDLEADIKEAQEALPKARVFAEEGIAAHKAADAKLSEAKKIVSEIENQNKVLQIAIEETTNLWINDTYKAVVDKLTSENFTTQTSRLEKAFEACRKLGLEFKASQEKAFFTRLKSAWHQECEVQRAKDEQARIKELMREEQQAEKARAGELKRIEKETRELEAQREQNAERIKLLNEMNTLKQLTEDQQRELTELSTKKEELEKDLLDHERRKSMAELTRAGHVYVISNVGSFGNKVFKVGMTRRLIPEDRIKELGDASVPFPFDIHLMIATEDAPALETKLHNELWDKRLNLVNDRKEFFSAEISAIKSLVDKHGGGVIYEFKQQATAAQWKESEARRKSGDLGVFDAAMEESDDTEEAA